MLKKTTWILGIALAGLVALAGAGCKKEAPEQKLPTYNKVPVNMPKLREIAATAGPAAQAAVRNVTLHLRYRRYVEALAALDQLKDVPGLSDAQKSVVDEVIGQIKQVAQKQPGDAGPAQ
jgi:hypothetical protein